jgi:hypothetical protein
LFTAGLVLVLWYAKWGVHGCDDLAGAGACGDRMDRDLSVYLLGLAALLTGTIVSGIAVVRAHRARRRTGPERPESGAVPTARDGRLDF